MGKLDGKRCLVTGAAQGIGLSIARLFSAEGGRVIAADIQLDGAPGAGALDGIETARLDVTDELCIGSLRDRIGHIDVLVNCAGYVVSGSALECTPAEFDKSMTLNVRSVYLVTSAFLPGMVERRAGSIVNMASVVSSVMAAPDRFAYGTSKAAVIGLTMSVAKDMAQFGVRCNAISPGTVDTPSLKARLSDGQDYEQARARFIARQPLGRLGTADEIASLALLMASDDGAFMTGANVVIDGGMSL